MNFAICIISYFLIGLSFVTIYSHFGSFETEDGDDFRFGAFIAWPIIMVCLIVLLVAYAVCGAIEFCTTIGDNKE